MHPPYTEAYEAKYRQALDYTLKGEPRDPTGGCVPPGMPRMMSDLYAMDFVITVPLR